jgi:hypothetical protein
MKQDWHGFARRLQLAERTIAATDISENNKKAILDFKRQLVVEGLTPARILTYMHKLRLLALDLDKDFHDCTKDDVMRLVEKREHSGVGEWTKLAYKVVLKRFFKWLRNSEDDYPPEVRWITATIRKDRLAGPGGVATRDPRTNSARSYLASSDKAMSYTGASGDRTASHGLACVEGQLGAPACRPQACRGATVEVRWRLLTDHRVPSAPLRQTGLEGIAFHVAVAPGQSALPLVLGHGQVSRVAARS